ncbi:carboxylesterase family protein [Sphingopyxis sp.]|jgi:para-nitrobenzyl esterase|uniref:carboxylesterase/lipase family protein n=1 Tax=Sphingopyxis sp. TaxID=1908224 RepID=UPI0025DA754F|nr:carboxylesterase family protein [Sphingopyxis sp.]MBK6411660.1 carboxylesterase family protein [Sphingopyxis sp.]
MAGLICSDVTRRARHGIFLALLLSLSTVASAAPKADPLRVATRLGVVEGVAIGQTRAFLGVPYAAPPVKDLRWKRPVPAAAWKGIRSATQFAAKCPSLSWGPGGGTVGNEDCLYLNIYTPKGIKERRPVAVWFHGGGFTAGASQDVDPSRFAEKTGTVVVTVNYRLGALGFASLPELDAESPTHGSGNYALLDQQAALRWVQENIKAFGGDPRRVTAMGESAGAFSIWAHIASPGARGLFHRAITMSGPNSSLADGMPMVERAVEQKRGASSKLAEEFGCHTRSKLLECLRAVPAAALVAAAGASRGWPGWTIILDGDVLPEQPRRMRELGKVARVPVLSGHTENEGGFFTAMRTIRPGAGWKEDDYRDAVSRAPFGAKILAAYPPHKYGSPDTTFATAVSNQWACGTQSINLIHSRFAPVYAYEFADRGAPPTLFAFPGAPKGAFHTAEIPYVFQTSYPSELHAGPPTFSPAQVGLSDRMLKTWGDFIWGREPAALSEFGKTGETAVLSPDGDKKLSSTEFREKHNCIFWDQTLFGDWMVNTGNLARS